MENYSITFTNENRSMEYIFSNFETAAAFFWENFSVNKYESGNMIDLRTGEVTAYFYKTYPDLITDYRVYRSLEFVNAINHVEVY